MLWIYIGVAGSLGSIVRGMISYFWFDKLTEGFPYGTLICNLSGSFLISMIAYQSWYRLPTALEVAIRVGFLGSFTTFSAFSMEFLNLLTQRMYFSAITYLGLSVLGGFFCAWLGYRFVIFFNQRGESLS
jgi:CrcB protein